MSKRLVTVGLFCGSCLVAGSGWAEPLEVSGVQLSRDLACKGKDLVIAGSGNQIKVTGPCGAVEIMGANHRVTLEQAKSLVVSGSENEVTIDKVTVLEVGVDAQRINATLVAGGQPASVLVTGAEGQVRLRLEAPATLNVEGSDQNVTWTGVEPELQIQGIDNKVVRE
jgi:hypothetical protein